MSQDTGGYCLLDSGGGRKLERFGDIILSRPCLSADWNRVLGQSVWDSADAAFAIDGEKEWSFNKPVPHSWIIPFGSMSFNLSLTKIGNVGLFPEHIRAWEWVCDAIHKAGKTDVSVLNLFAYTGGATLAAAKAGAKVTHLDASKSVVATARKNAAENGLQDASIRWIVDDVMKFMRREKKRCSKYEIIVMDPPSFGRGSSGEVFKIEKALDELLSLCYSVLAEDPLLFFLSCHTAGFTPDVLHDILVSELNNKEGMFSSGELVLPAEQGVRPIPSGAYSLWTASK